jgi:peptide/nickel transport system permease protein
MPGDPAVMLAGPEASEEVLKMIRDSYGLDKPVHEQLFIYMSHVLRGDLGYSYAYQAPVMDVIVSRIPATMLLTGTALTFAFIIGVILGVIASKKPYSIIDNAATGVAVAFYSIPFFWLAQILLIIFALFLGWFPTGGIMSFRTVWSSITLEYILDRLHHLALPATALAMWYIAAIFRLTRASMLETLREDYIVFARSKGLKERKVLYKHALRNALFPVITIVGLYIGWAFSGVIFTEMVFAWPGLGRLMYDSIYSRDYPVLMGMYIFISISILVTNLIVDVIYAILDPRVRYG